MEKKRRIVQRLVANIRISPQMFGISQVTQYCSTVFSWASMETNSWPCSTAKTTELNCFRTNTIEPSGLPRLFLDIYLFQCKTY